MGEKMNQKNKRGIGEKAYALVLAVLMVVLLTVPASAAVFQSPSRAIAIVFDNSGSMYYASNATAWCRATYAIEVFASMMNDGDVLEVYPMYEVEVDGNTYNDNNPVRITNKTSSIIRSMYTPKAAATPIETIDRAFSGVTAATADEKWLIVLTDGDEFYENGKGLGTGDETKAALTKRLSEYNKAVNVMYLGIGASAAKPEINGNKKHYTTSAKDTANVLAELTTMCNNIFGRDELKNNGKTISFDLPMSKLIVFVQGDNISNVEVKNSAGKSVGEVVSFYNPRYGEKGSGNYPIKIDKSLQGSIITYANCEKGDYTITYDGSMSSISVYFEPDVDLSVVLKNPEGGVISPDAAYEGTYTVSYHMVDKYGQGGPGYTIPAEFVPEYKHIKGALAAARRGDQANPAKESSGSQFYIVQNEETCAQLDGAYTVFGQTVDGFNVIDKIAAVATDRRDRPVTDVRIITIKVDPESMPAEPADTTKTACDSTAAAPVAEK